MPSHSELPMPIDVGIRRSRRSWSAALAATFLAATTVLVGCKDGTGPGPGQETGTLQVEIDGFVGTITTAGTATITGPSIDTTVTLPPIASASLTVPVGTYSVVYLPPLGYAIAPGTPNDVDVTVAEDSTSQVSFSVIQAAGTLRLTVDGLLAGASSGGSASVLRTDVGGQTPVIAAITGSGIVQMSVVPGTYSVTYTPPEDYQLVAGEANPKNAAVPLAGADTVGFVVEQEPGDILIQVGGLGGAASGGSASVLRTDIGGQTPQVTAIPAGGVVQLTVRPGTYSVDFTPPDGFVLVPGEDNPQVVVVTPNDTATASFQVEIDDGGPPDDVIFKSDFSTALGTGVAALLDTGQPVPWDLIVGNGDLNEVIPSTGLDFPTANVLRVEAGWRDSPPGAAAQNPRLDDGVPIPAVGDSLFYRWYIRVVAPDAYTADPLTHPIQDATNGGSTNWMFEVNTNSNGTWDLSWNFDGPGGVNPFPNNRWRPPSAMSKNVTYRVDLLLVRVGTSTYQVHSRVYQGTTLLYDDDDFRNSNSSASLADVPTFTFNILQNLSGFQAGFNGLSAGTESEFPFVLYYQGGFCIRTVDWCGEYAGGL